MGSQLRVVVLGAGFGGLELVTCLAEGLGGDGDIVLIDSAETFHFGFSKLDVLVGLKSAESVVHPYAGLAAPGVRFVNAAVTAIHPANRQVDTSAGTFDADVLVVALGAEANVAATPGLAEAGHEFYTFGGAVDAHDALEQFAGGRVLVAVTAPPIKCPPAPSEAALLVHDFLTARGIRDTSEVTLSAPFAAPIPPSPEGSAAVLAAFDERNIRWLPQSGLASVDTSTNTAVFADGSSEAFDLLLAVPLHRVPAVVADSGLCRDGWVAVDTTTMETGVDGVYAIGDVAAANAPKAGAFAVHQANVVADRIIARHRGGRSDAAFDASGACLMEFGGGAVARVAITGRRTGGGFTSTFAAASPQLLDDKENLISSSLARWFRAR